jgi:hypothetical protein
MALGASALLQIGVGVVMLLPRRLGGHGRVNGWVCVAAGGASLIIAVSWFLGRPVDWSVSGPIIAVCFVLMAISVVWNLRVPRQRKQRKPRGPES